MIDERELYEITADEVVVDGITYRKRPSSSGPDLPCWDGGAVGGIVFVNWRDRTKRMVETNPWKVYGGGSSYGSGYKTFEKAASAAYKNQKREYEAAKKAVADYETAKEKAK